LASLTTLTVALAQPKPATRPPAGQPAAPAARPAATSAAAPADHKADEQAIRQLIAAFTKTYNARDAKALAAMFTVDGEIVAQDGGTTHGRTAIEQFFSDEFQQHPKSKMDDVVESIRFLGPIAAVEEGVSTITHEPDEPGESGHYCVIYVKQEGKWLIASDRDLPDDDADSKSELERLGWLVGSWVDESSEGLVKTRYEWADNHHFLIGEYTVHVAGKPVLTGTQRIGWDPLARKVRSWVFDSEGGFGDSYWTRDGDQWIVKLTGVTHDGVQGSSTSLYTRLGPDKFSFQSRDRVHGSEVIDETRLITVVREPPKPGK
jgi:uncharacterized protein (TIGR02246 family)